MTSPVAYPLWLAGARDVCLVAWKRDRDRGFTTQGFALPAGLGAKPAMLMMSTVLIAFLGTKLARLGTGFDHPPDNLVIAAGTA